MFCDVVIKHGGRLSDLCGGRRTDGVCLTFCKRFLLPTDAQANCFQRNIKIYIDITTAATCFGVNTIIRGCTV